MKKIILLELVLLFLATTFSSDNPPGWYQQTLPVSGEITDMFFLDSLNGWNTFNNGYILKTINGGDNWEVQIDSAGSLYSIQFLDTLTGYAGGTSAGHRKFYKTTNGGKIWLELNVLNSVGIINEISFINKDTGWVCSRDNFDGGVFKTTDGGGSWVRQLNYTIDNPLKIFFINKDVGWIGNDFGKIFKTINGGINWNLQVTFNSIKDIFFVNPDTGWIADGGGSNVKFTSNGGTNWIYQQVPPEGGLILFSRPNRISSLNGRNAWGVGGNVFFGMGRVRGIIYKTTNSGNNWYYQLPDTSIDIGTYTNIQFISDSIGWAAYTGLIHTNDGGGPLVNVTNINSELPNSFSLSQNYPNPFNPVTKIKYELRNTSYIELKVFNIRGIEIIKLVDQKQNAGAYEAEFDGSELASGVYFYRLNISDERSGQIFSDTKSMILIK